MSFGLMGGGVQAQGHVQFLLNHFVFGMDRAGGDRRAALPPLRRAARRARAADSATACARRSQRWDT